jgi:hypothetical protein
MAIGKTGRTIGHYRSPGGRGRGSPRREKPSPIWRPIRPVHSARGMAVRATAAARPVCQRNTARLSTWEGIRAGRRQRSPARRCRGNSRQSASPGNWACRCWRRDCCSRADTSCTHRSSSRQSAATPIRRGSGVYVSFQDSFPSETKFTTRVHREKFDPRQTGETEMGARPRVWPSGRQGFFGREELTDVRI